MTHVADRFSMVFRNEHRAIRDGLMDVIQAFHDQAPDRARTLLAGIAMFAGPHFRYEEEAMYPALVQIFGRKYIETLLREHDEAIRSAEQLMYLSVKDRWTEEDVGEATELARGILPHVSDCDGLSVMVERLPAREVDAILAARDRSLAEGIDLVRWAREIRQFAPALQPPS
jgi:hypothetical protein